MDDKIIKISCKGATVVDFHELVEFQGNLKDRTREQIDKLKSLIISDGFSYPFFIWNNESVKNIIDGHGRLIALRELENEGWEIPLLPANYILADNEHDAKLKLLKCISRYGDITEASYAFFTYGISVEELSNVEILFDKVEILKVDSDIHLEEVRNMLENSEEEPSGEIIIRCPYCLEESSYTITEIKKAIKKEG